MNKQPSLISIILKIWIAALIMNTLFGTALLTDLFTNADLIGLVALMGIIYAILLTIPLIALLFICMRIFLRMNIAGRKLFALFFITGQFLTVAFVTLFFLMIGGSLLPVWSILFVAIGSGSLAILLEYRPIIHLQKNDDQLAQENFLR